MFQTEYDNPIFGVSEKLKLQKFGVSEKLKIEKWEFQKIIGNLLNPSFWQSYPFFAKNPIF